MAKTGMPSSTSAAATSSWVERGLLAQSTASTPPARRVSARFAVSVVTCAQATRRNPRSGCSRAKRSRICPSTGISRAAQVIRWRPRGASAGSLMSKRAAGVCTMARVPPLSNAECGVRNAESRGGRARSSPVPLVLFRTPHSALRIRQRGYVGETLVEAAGELLRRVAVLLRAQVLDRVGSRLRRDAAGDLEREAARHALPQAGAERVTGPGRVDHLP